jgi:hypothetical protein
MNRLTPLGQALVLCALGLVALSLALFLVTHYGQDAACVLLADCVPPHR